MDPALLCEAQLGEDETDSEIMLFENEESEEQETSQTNKRPHPSNGEKSTPTKKMRESFSSKNVKCSPHSPSPSSQKHATSASHNIKNNLSHKAQMQRQRLGTPPGSNARVSAPAKKTHGAQKTLNRSQGQFNQKSVTWSYRRLQENAYTADIKKSDLLKDYEPDKCECKPPEGGFTGANVGCRSGCHNRAIYVECDKDVCSNGDKCGNRVIQEMQYAPGLERFMTVNKGWGVRARQAVASGTFILEYTGEIVSQKEFEKRMLSGYIEDEHHYCLALDSKHMIDAHRAGSECRFVNHSCDPNCEMRKWNVKGLYRMALFAKKDILANTEICYDYNFSLFDSDKGQTCHCGAKECRGVIGGKNKDFAIKIEGQKGQNTTTLSTATDPTIQLKVDEKWFNQNLQKDELSWFQKNAPKSHQLGAKQVKCTVCNEQLNHTHLGQIQRHPALGVVMCNHCRKKYSKVTWDKSADGNDDSCRWCTEGGNIFLCDHCPSAFCQKCIKWNLGRKFVKEIDDAASWKCLLCDPGPLKAARSLYWAVHQYHKTRQSAKSRNTTPVKTTPIKNGKKFTPTQPQHQIKQVQVRPPLVTNGQTQSRGVLNARGSPSGNAISRMKFNPRPTISAVVNQSQSHRPMSNGGINKQIGRVIIPNGSRESPTPKHWLHKMMNEVENSTMETMDLMNDLRKNWTNTKKGEDDETKITRKLREIFQIHKKTIDELDKKLLNEYRMNREDADLRDIEPETIDNLKHNDFKKRSNEIFSKSSLEVENDNIDGVVCTPDMPVYLGCSDDEDEEENVESEPAIVTLDEDSSDNDSDIESVNSDESIGVSENDSNKEGSGTDETESDGEIKMTNPKNENIFDETSEEQSETDIAGSDNNENNTTDSESNVTNTEEKDLKDVKNQTNTMAESKNKENGKAKMDLDSKEKENESDNDDTITTETVPDSNNGLKIEDKSDSEEELKTEAKSNDENLRTEVQSDGEVKVKTEAKSVVENLKTEVQSDSEEKVKTEAKSDCEKVKAEEQSEIEEKVKTEAKSDCEEIKAEVQSDVENEVNSDYEKAKAEVESDSKDKVNLEMESVDEIKVDTETVLNLRQDEGETELEINNESLDIKVNEEKSTNDDEVLHPLANNGDVMNDSKLDYSDKNLDNDHSKCQDSISELDHSKLDANLKHKDTEGRKDMGK